MSAAAKVSPARGLAPKNSSNGPLDDELPMSVIEMATSANLQTIEEDKEPLVLHPSPQAHSNASSLQKLLPQYLPQLALIVFLYVLQGVPLGLVFGSIPYMLKATRRSSISYGHFGLFSLAGYPYSLKLLWSPLVDHFYSSRIGRRKSWILPVQAAVGAVFWILSGRIDEWIQPGKPVDFWKLNGSFLVLVSFCATLDIAVDGWALTLLPSAKRHWASTCQSVGLNLGVFISFTCFLALSSERFCVQFLGLQPDVDPTSSTSNGLVTLGSFMKFWAGIYITSTLLLAFKREQDHKPTSASTITPTAVPALHSKAAAARKSKIVRAYRSLLQIIRLPAVRSFALILLTFKFAFSAFDAVAPLKLLEKGFPKESLALTVLIDFPFQLAMGLVVARWSNRKDTDKSSSSTALSKPKSTLQPWIIATYARIAMTCVAMYVISRFNAPVTTANTTAIIVTTVLTSFCHTAMFVSMGTFFLRISDARYGGTYLTLFNTINTFAGMWPKLPVMTAVELLTFKNCSCRGGVPRVYCQLAGGRCNITFDGFYLVSGLCLLVGLIWFQFWIKPNIEALQLADPAAWILPDSPQTAKDTESTEPNCADKDFHSQSADSLTILK